MSSHVCLAGEKYRLSSCAGHYRPRSCRLYARPAIVGRGEADDIPGRLIENLDTLWGAKLSRIRRFSSAVRALASMTSVAKPISSLTLKANTPRLVVRVALISPKVEVESAIDRALEWVSIALSQ